MKRLYAAIAALLVLAFASTIQAQDPVELVPRYRHIGLIDSVSVDKGNWNAVYKIKKTNPENPDTIWVVGDSGKVRRYQVEIDDHRPQLDTLDTLSFSLGSKYTLCDVCFPSHRYGYIVGYEQRELGGGEIPGVPVPGKGKIWYNHNAVTSPTNWQMADTMYMPPVITSHNVPCLSVDFYDDEHGYVGCGCGYVLYSYDRGQTWYALDDTTLQKKPPWDSVAWSIGSIPRDMDEDLRYYNHFGDWLTEWVSLLESNND